jgi:hypothetical protein
MKNSLKFIALAMTIWLVVLAIFAGIALAFGHGWSDWYKPAMVCSVMILIGVSAVASNFKTKPKVLEQS